MTLGRQGWLGGGTSPAGQGLSRKTAQRTGTLRRQKSEERQTSREVKQWRFGMDCSCIGQGKKINNCSSFSSSRTSFLDLRIKYLRLIQFIFYCVFSESCFKTTYFKSITLIQLLPSQEAARSLLEQKLHKLFLKDIGSKKLLVKEQGMMGEGSPGSHFESEEIR